MTASPSILRPLLPALAAALLALPSQALPEQCDDKGPGVPVIGTVRWWNSNQLIYTATIYNCGTADADNMVSETRSA